MRKIAFTILTFFIILSTVYSADSNCDILIKKVKDFMGGLDHQYLALTEKDGYFPSWETTGTTRWTLKWIAQNIINESHYTTKCSGDK